MIKERMSNVPSHGLVLTDYHLDYTDLREFGEIRIYYDPKRGAVVEVREFDFDNATSCRDTCAKAMAWGRDVLDAAVRAESLVPGGTITPVAA